MIKRITLVIVVLVVAILAFAATKPDDFHVQRTTTINAPPEKIVGLIDDFHAWSSWSPFERLDPALKRTYSGPERGAGAIYEWDGNSQAGSGRMEIIDRSPSKVEIALDFNRPFESHNIAEFTLEPKGASTDVTWAMHGPNLFIGKVMSVFVSMDDMVGSDFETGLQNLKALAEQ
jgi:hypothetical protein